MGKDNAGLKIFTITATLLSLLSAGLVVVGNGDFKFLETLTKIASSAEDNSSSLDFETNQNNVLGKELTKGESIYVACYYESNPNRLLTYRVFVAQSSLDPRYQAEKDRAVKFLLGKDLTINNRHRIYEDSYPAVVFRHFIYRKIKTDATFTQEVHSLCDAKKRSSDSKIPFGIESLVVRFSDQLGIRVVVNEWSTLNEKKSGRQ
jgi:hypothetical protein